MRPSMEHLAAAFDNRPVAAAQPDWLTALQQQAWQRAFAHGLPWRKDEHWKYTSLFKLAKLPLVVPADGPAGTVPDVQPVYSGDDAIVLEFRNGRPHSAGPLPEGITFRRVDQDAAFLTNKPARHSVMQDLNHAFADAICALAVAPGTRLDKPIYLVHALDGKHVLSSQRLHIEVGDNCELDIVDHLTGGATDSVNNRRITLSIGSNSQVHHTQIQQEDTSTTLIDNIDVTVGRDANYVSHVFDLGAALARHDLGISLTASNAHSTMLAAYMPSDGQHVDHHTLVKHNHSHTTSEQRYHGVAGARGHGVFNGKVLVQKDSQKISAEQSNQNILLCEQAAIDTKPELEIYADDVKCSHGATVGQLDETSLFYLQSRGLGYNEARQLLVRGFVRDIYADVRCQTLHAWLDGAITTKLDQLVEQLA